LLDRPVAKEVVDLGGELGTVLTDRPTRLGVGTQHEVVANAELRQHLRPHPRLPVVDDEQFDEPAFCISSRSSSSSESGTRTSSICGLPSFLKRAFSVCKLS
jgi:hypothetical protein